MNAAEQLIEQGRAEGLQKGIEKGRAEGIEKGRAEGIEKGIQKGRLEGLRTAIAAALSARSLPLSELGLARLDACTDVDVLTRWLTRAMAAASEAEVFAQDIG